MGLPFPAALYPPTEVARLYQDVGPDVLSRESDADWPGGPASPWQSYLHRVLQAGARDEGVGLGIACLAGGQRTRSARDHAAKMRAQAAGRGDAAQACYWRAVGDWLAADSPADETASAAMLRRSA